MANVFIHFEPIGAVGGELEYGTTELPPYLIPGSPDEANWKLRNPDGHKIMRSASYEKGATEAHKAALDGNLNDLKDYVNVHEDSVNARDANGWTPLHEAIRKGDMDITKFLLERGSDANSRTGRPGEFGGSALYLAKLFHGDDHSIIDLLKQYNARHMEPGMRDEL